MKILVIPDLHGKDYWARVVHESEFDKVIFLGDYTDSYTHTDTEIIDNLEGIIQLKKLFPKGSVELLLGNHDIQYMFYPNYRCSGFRESYRLKLWTMFNHNKDLFKVAHQEGKHLFTHAGISNRWFARHKAVLQEAGLEINMENLSDVLNMVNNSSKQYILHEVGSLRGGDRYDCGGITWADIHETDMDYLSNFHQVVGHSKIARRMRVSHQDGLSSITYTDHLDSVTEFLTLEI